MPILFLIGGIALLFALEHVQNGLPFQTSVPGAIPNTTGTPMPAGDASNPPAGGWDQGPAYNSGAPAVISDPNGATASPSAQPGSNPIVPQPIGGQNFVPPVRFGPPALQSAPPSSPPYSQVPQNPGMGPAPAPITKGPTLYTVRPSPVPVSGSIAHIGPSNVY